MPQADLAVVIEEANAVEAIAFVALAAPTVVTLPDGSTVTGILAMTIFPGAVDGRITAVLRVSLEGQDVDIHPLLSIQTLEEWARLQGLRLVPA